jgi:hypothetical protein
MPLRSIFIDKALPQGLKASYMYGLKPVPFTTPILKTAFLSPGDDGAACSRVSGHLEVADAT